MKHPKLCNATLMNDEKVYGKLKKDPAQKFQAKLIKLLKELKESGAIDSRTYWKIYPTTCDVPKFYGLIKVHKAAAPLRPIVSGIGSVTYELAKFVAGIIAPLIGKTDCHKNTQSFVDKIKDIHVKPDESLVSFDVTALFTSIPVSKTVEIIQDRLEKDKTWKTGDAENLEVEQVIRLLRFCLDTTYFTFRDNLYQQQDGCAMGSPCSPLSANAYMEYL